MVKKYLGLALAAVMLMLASGEADAFRLKNSKGKLVDKGREFSLEYANSGKGGNATEWYLSRRKGKWWINNLTDKKPPADKDLFGKLINFVPGSHPSNSESYLICE